MGGSYNKLWRKSSSGLLGEASYWLLGLGGGIPVVDSHVLIMLFWVGDIEGLTDYRDIRIALLKE